MTDSFPHIENYKFLKVIGQGGMGTVYLATHTVIGRKVAIKILSKVYSRDQAIRDRFRNEAVLLSELRHPNIVALYDYIEKNDGLCLIMEYVEGITLDAYISSVSGPIPEPKSIELFLKILDAFEYAHSKHIIHRDIKPSNVMLTPNNDVKILDFGIAKVADRQNHKLTLTGMRLGTLYYMSPEQVRSRDTDHRSDIYSLGVLFFEMLTGRNPYENLSEYDINLKIVNDPLPRADAYYPNISDHSQSVIDKATAKNPMNRFQSVEEFKKALADTESIVESGKNLFGEEETKLVVEWTFQTLKEKKAREMLQEQWRKNMHETKEKEEKKVIEEKIFLENLFGSVSNKKIVFQKGKDLFENGQPEEITLDQLESVKLNSNREYLTGLFFLLVAGLLIYFLPGVFKLLLALPFITLSVLCFREYPGILIIRTDEKKIKMKGWPWHYEKAKEYVKILKKVLHYYHS